MMMSKTVPQHSVEGGTDHVGGIRIYGREERWERGYVCISVLDLVTVIVMIHGVSIG